MDRCTKRPPRPTAFRLPRIFTVSFLGMVTILATPTRVEAQTGPPPVEVREIERPRESAPVTHVPGEVLVAIEGGRGPNDPDVHALVLEFDLTRLGFNSSIRVHHFRIPDSVPLEDILNQLREHPLVDFAELNLLYTLGVTPNDSFYDNYSGNSTDLQKWVFDGIGADSGINAEAAWDITTGRTDVVIAIIDSGVDLDHPDLLDNIWIHPTEIAGNSIDDDGNGFVDDVNGWDFRSNDNDPNPDLGDGIDNDGSSGADSNVFHGTFVASCASGVSNNGLGVAGAAWNCKLMALKVFSDDGGASSVDIANAITYAADNGADVTNLSLGGGFSSTIQNAINYSWNQGVVNVASAGNSNVSSAQYPASLTHVISVAAGDSGSVAYGGSGDIDGRASFSQYGVSAVDVVAPGSKLIAAAVRSVADGNPGSPAYFVSSGTSFSGPIVAGLAALIISRARDLGSAITNDDVESIIQDTAQDLPDDPDDSPNGGANWDNHGRVDFLAALDAIPDPAGNNPPVANAGSDVTVDCAPPSGATASLDGNASSDPDLDSLTFAWSATGISFDNSSSATPSATFPIGSTVATLTVTDLFGASNADTVTVTVVGDTMAPNLSCPGDITAECASLSGTAVQYAASATDGCDGSVPVSINPPSGTLFSLGSTTVTCSSTDAAGNTADCQFQVTITDTTSPTIECPDDVSVKFASPSGGIVEFDVTATDLCDVSPDIIATPPPGSVFTVGTTLVECTATDFSGNVASCSFTVTVTTDTEAPSLQCPTSITVPCPGQSGAVVSYEASATDDCDPDPDISFDPPSGSSFGVGTTQVICTATDESGNFSQCEFLVTVTDSSAPTIDCPEDQIVVAGGDTAVVQFTVNATDDCDPSPDIVASPPSGSTFSLGETTVVCTATDQGGNQTQCAFLVYVVADDLSCRRGNVNAAAGPITDVLFVNNSAGDPENRAIVMSRDDPLSICMENPPSNLLGRSAYMLCLWVGTPNNGTLSILPEGFGISCMPIPFDGPVTPRVRKIAINIVDSRFPFVEKWPGPSTEPAPYKLLDVPRVGRPIEFFLQGIIEDSASDHGQFAVTNGIRVVSE